MRVRLRRLRRVKASVCRRDTCGRDTCGRGACGRGACGRLLEELLRELTRVFSVGDFAATLMALLRVRRYRTIVSETNYNF